MKALFTLLLLGSVLLLSSFKQKNTIAIREKDKMGGLGLKNVERRLFLLYPDKYTLHINNENGIYESELTLKLL